MLDAILEELMTKHGMVDATTVGLGGSSSGGFGVYAVVDHFAESVRRLTNNANVRVVGIPDGGFFADLEGSAASLNPASLSSKWKSAHGKICATTSASCRAYHTQEPWKCIMPQYSLEHITTPMFVVNPSIDNEQTSWGAPFLGISCTRSAKWPQCNDNELRRVYDYQQRFLDVLRPALQARLASGRETGYFVPACSLHIQTVSYCDGDHPNCIGWHTHTVVDRATQREVNLNKAVAAFLFNGQADGSSAAGDTTTTTNNNSSSPGTVPTKLLDLKAWPENQNCVYPRAWPGCANDEGIDSASDGGTGKCRSSGRMYVVDSPYAVRCASVFSCGVFC
jgi:hypothetical protein